ncbi:hypothetical protein ILUMI_19716 [Ignelater luminosus]|uniref:HAT C-terminal dimerisation domain-containing protein n=1 Tax=Ignelater luminosus TaxID=2038154 RepID=A0A8K0CL61_IGNLU|nr:hypothetical protein ILUMI_19716 [Ignelater luminosus]
MLVIEWTVGHPVLGKLVKKEFRNWKNALEVFAGHESTDYHTFSVTKFQNIGLIEEKKQNPIHYQLDVASKHRIEKKYLANVLIITTLEGLNINSNFMVGQGYDGASSMSGAFHRVQVYIRPKYSSAIYVHCASHSLSLPISDAYIVPQTINIDLSQEILLAKNVRNTLAEVRQNAVQEFKKIFEAAQSSCEKYGVEISTPRVTSRQTKRDNVPHSTLEEYFRRTIFAPFVDSLILHLDERLLSHDQTLRSFVNEVALRQLYAVYEHLLDAESFEIVLGEVKLWYTVWKKNNKTPKTAMDVLAFLLQNNTKLFLNVEALLKIIVTIAVTTASNERTFSALRSLKTYLRNTAREDRLNGLALFNIHRETPVSVDEIINLFSKQKNRRLEFFCSFLKIF